MISVGISTMVVLLIFCGIPVLYVWKVKHPSRSLWKMSVYFSVIFYATPLVAGMILSRLTGVAFHGLDYAFHLDHDASVTAVHLLLTTGAVFLSSPLSFLATRVIKRS